MLIQHHTCFTYIALCIKSFLFYYIIWASWQIRKFVVAHAPGIPGTVFPPPRVSNPYMDFGTCVTQVPWCMPGSLNKYFLWSWWRGKRSQHSRCMHNTWSLRIWQEAHCTANIHLKILRSLYRSADITPHANHFRKQKATKIYFTCFNFFICSPFSYCKRFCQYRIWHQLSLNRACSVCHLFVTI